MHTSRLSTCKVCVLLLNVNACQVYGFQGTKEGTSSECIVGRFAQRTKLEPGEMPLIVGTKFFTVPWTNFLVGGGIRLGRQSLLDALRASLARLQLKTVPLYQVCIGRGLYGPHWPPDQMRVGVPAAVLAVIRACGFEHDSQI